MRKEIMAVALVASSMGVQAQTAPRLGEGTSQLPTYRWRVEAEAGVSCSVLDADVSGLGGTTYKVRPGLALGLVAECNVVDHLAVAAGIRFVQRNWLYQNLGSDAWNTRYANNFISIPLTVGYYLLHNPYKEKGLWLKPQVGVYYDYFTSMHTRGIYYMNLMEGYSGDGIYQVYKSTYDFHTNENHLRRSLFGCEAGLQVGYSFGRIDASVGYRFQYGLSHIYQDKSRTSKTARRNSSVITAAVAYKF